MGGTSPGFPAVRGLAGQPAAPDDGALDAFFDTMSGSPSVPPATGPQRIERRPTPLPSLTAESDQRVQAAIAASARAEASLNGLFRTIEHLGSGVGGAREANELLTQELEALRDMLGAANEQQFAFEQKISLLEQTLDRTRQESARDREFLTEQHDAFIVDLMDEQEGELGRRDRDLAVLRARLGEIERRSTLPTVAPPADLQASARVKFAPSALGEGSALDRAERAELERTAQKLAEDRERARETVQRLQAQRDEAQAAVARITQERDEALQQVHRLKSELGGPRLPPSTRPPPVEPRKSNITPTRPPSALSQKPRSSELTLDDSEIDARLSRPPVSAPQLNVPQGSAAQKPTTPAPPISSVVTPPRSNPLAAVSFTPRPSPSLDPLRHGLSSSPVLQPLGASSRPPLKQKPDVSTRPLVGYSVNDESVETEQLEGFRLSKPPPRSDKR